MRRGLLSRPLPKLPASLEERARDLLVRAQAALSDGQRGAALRALGALFDLLVPFVDAAVQKEAGAEDPSTCAIGLPGLWRELPDIDAEREPLADLLLWHAAQAQDEALLSAPPQWAWFEEYLRGRPLPHSERWRRLCRGAGPLGDRARVQVQRGATIVLERLPKEAPAPAAGIETDLGVLRSGDRLVLQVQLPLPGRLAVLHTVLGPSCGDLAVLLPVHEGEEAVRRAFEVVEVAGELTVVPDGPEQGLLCVWVPELLPPAWLQRALSTERLPPDSRAWLYRYRVE